MLYYLAPISITKTDHLQTEIESAMSVFMGVIQYG